MKKNIFFTVLIVTLLARIVHSQTNPACAFYPLNIGDVWQYQVTFVLNNTHLDTTYYSFKEVLGDTLMPNGYHYKIVSEESLGSYQVGDMIIRYLLVDSVSAKVYVFRLGWNWTFAKL